MKVAYLMRVDALDKSGGDVEHMRNYIRGCEQVAAEQGLAFQGEILTDLYPELSGFDVVHLTNLDRPVELYAQFQAAKAADKPIVITPLHHSYREIENYERAGRGGVIGLVSGVLGFHLLESARMLVRSRRYPQLRRPLWEILRRGLRKAQAEVLLGCDRVLVIADKEATDIQVDIAALPSERVFKLNNGFQPLELTSQPRDIEIAVVARVEARKNQIAILEAVEKLGLKATFVGPPNPNHRSYCEEFRRRIASSASTYIPGVPPHEVAAILARSKVHVAASWFEVASLVDVDAYVHGARVVASLCGGTREVIGADAFYVDPASPSDISAKIAQAVASVRAGEQNDVETFLQRVPGWEEVCARLLALYVSLLGSKAGKRC